MFTKKSLLLLGFLSLSVTGSSDTDSSYSAATSSSAAPSSSASASTTATTAAATTPLSAYDECVQFFNAKRYGQAIYSCQKAIGEQSENNKDADKLGESLLLLADAQEHNNNPWLALDALRRILAEVANKSILEKAFNRKAKIHIKFGEFQEARDALTKIADDQDAKDKGMKHCEEAEKLTEKIEKAYKEEKWQQVQQEAHELISNFSPYYRDAYDMRIKALSSLREVQRAIDVARSKARMETDSSETDFLIGKLYLSLGNVVTGRKFINECCKLNPENRKCMALRSKLKYFDQILEDVNDKMLLKEAVEALENLQKLMEKVPEEESYYDKNFPQLFQGFKIPVLKLLCAKQARRKHGEAQTICEEAQRLDPSHQEYYLTVLGELKLSQNQYDEAMNLFRQAQRLDPKSKEIRELLQKTEKLQREKAKTKHYDTLGVRQDATAEEIKKAHSKLVRKYHPDKQRDTDSKKDAEKRIQEINAAYGVLSDKKKRQQYDAGIDPDDPNSGAQNFHYGGGNPFGGGHHHHYGGGGQQFSFNMNDFEDLFGGGGRKKKNAGGGRRHGGGPFDFFRDDL